MAASNVIGERFELLSLVGAGGMGRVYRARDLVTGGDAAVKILDEKSTETARFDREAALLAGLSHPAIVRYLGHGATPLGLRYLAMEWLDGEDLRSRLRRAELAADDAIALVERVADALAAAHERGIIHRDLKPGNIFLHGGDPRRAKVIDFGIAHFSAGDRLTLTGSMLGTPGYMAPEQAQGTRGIDARADVYSLGCVLFRCLTGRTPFVGETSLAVVIKSTVEEAPRLGELRPDLPRALEDLVARALGRDPSARPKDGATLAAELRSLGQRPPSMRPRSIAPPALSHVEKRLGCFLVARTETPLPAAVLGDATVSETTGIELSTLVKRYGGRLYPLADSALFVTFSSEGGASPEVPTDLAVRAARCASGLVAALPGARFALSAGQTVTLGWAPEGEAIDRGAALIGGAQPSEVRLDAVMERLLEGRFVIGHDDRGALLRDEMDAGAPARTLLGKPIAIVGRDAELLRLESFVAECASEPVARAVIVKASAGMGKSRLMHELTRRLSVPRAEGAAPSVWIGRGDMMSVRSPHAVVGSAIRKAARISGGEPLGLRRQKLLARVQRSLPRPEAARVASFLGEIAGAPFPDDRGELSAARQDPRVLGDQVRRAWIDWLRAETRAHPVVLVLEDLHWGDTPSVSLIDAALGDLAEAPLCVIALARPEIDEAFPDLFASRSPVVIPLSGLSKRAGEKLVRSALGPSHPPEEVERLLARAAGNAFCLEELIREAAEGRGDALPDTVLAMVHARLDRLGSEARRALRAASVFGERFWREGVVEVLGEGDAWIDDALRDLVRRELIEPRVEPHLSRKEAYSFRHALVRDAAYALFTDDDLRLSHERAGDFLERVGEDDDVVLARHFQAGGAPLRASSYYGRAGQRAMEGNDLTQVLAHTASALACGAAGPERGALLVLEAEAHGWRGELGDAERCCSEAMELLPAGSALWCQAAGGAVMAYLQLGYLARFVDVARRLSEVEPATDAIDRYVLGAVLVLAYLWTGGLYDLARSFMERTERIARTGSADATTLVFGAHRPTNQPQSLAGVVTGEDDPRPPGMDALASFSAMGWLGWMRAVEVKYTTHDPLVHLTLSERAAQCLRKAGDARGDLRVRIELGIAHRALGDDDASLRELHAARSIAERLGMQFFVASAEVHLSSTLLQAERWDEAERAALTAMDTCAAADNRILGALARGNLALLHLHRGDPTTALEHLRIAADVLIAPPAHAYCLGALAEVHLAAGDVPSAQKAAHEAETILTRLQTIPEGDAYTRCILAEVHHAAGHPDRALSAITSAAQRLEQRASALPNAEARARFYRVPANARTLARLASFRSQE